MLDHSSRGLHAARPALLMALTSIGGGALVVSVSVLRCAVVTRWPLDLALPRLASGPLASPRTARGEEASPIRPVPLHAALVL